MDAYGCSPAILGDVYLRERVVYKKTWYASRFSPWGNQRKVESRCMIPSLLSMLIESFPIGLKRMTEPHRVTKLLLVSSAW